MKLTVSFDMGNAAFDDDNGGPHNEASRIMRDIAYQLEEREANSGVIRDINGNRIGNWSIQGERG